MIDDLGQDACSPRDALERERQTHQTSQTMVHLVIDNLPLGIFWKDCDLRYLGCNLPFAHAAGLTSPEEIVGKSDYDLTWKVQPSLNQAEDLDVIQTGSSYRGIEEVQSIEDGQKRKLRSKKQPLYDSSGKIIGLLGTYEDITDLKGDEEEQRAVRAQMLHAQKIESLGVLAGGIAHDFNNLLMTILGNADLARNEVPPTSPVRQSLEEIEQASRRAAELCRQLLAYSGRGQFQIVDLNLNQVVNEMAQLLEVSISKKAVLRYNLAVELPTIRGDAVQMRQLIMNLITNASDAIGARSGVVMISTGIMQCDRPYLAETYLDDNLPEGDYVFIEVADTGCGMDTQTRERIFDPFFSTKFMGRGLGLAAVLGIVRSHQCALKVYTEPNKGSSFKVLFPVCQETTNAESTCTPATLYQGKGTVLVVDDEESIRKLCSRMLERIGFSVLTAADGLEAIEIYRRNSHTISCVLLDLTMPHMDGDEAFRQLRLINPGVKVIVSSGYNKQELIQRFAGKGALAFIQKPYQLKVLSDMLREIFS